MDRLLKAGAAALLAMTLAVPATAVARVPLNLNMPDNPVLFSHARHAKLECVTCHSAQPATNVPAAPVKMTLPQSCQSCHEMTNETPPADGCANCHNPVSNT